VAALGQAIAERIGEPRYHFWFAANTKFAWEHERLVVGVPNHFFQEWLEKTFAEPVRAAASEVLGRPMQVQFAIDPELFQAHRRAQAQAKAPALAGGTPSESPAAAGHAPPGAKPKRTRRWHRLSDLVVGACNRMAHASAVSTVEAPAEAANPLVLHGPVGTGKTHLLEGIYGGLRKAQPEWRVVFVTAEEFTNRFVQGMRLGKLGSFRKHFRECDALLIDDLQFLAGKPATEEEFLHTFDALQADGRLVVVTCDCHPKLGGDFSPLLTDRLVGGAVWGVTPPDRETRLRILRYKAGRGEPPLPEAVLDFLAEQLRGNVRELEGGIHSIRHYSQVTGRPIDLELARQAVGDLIRHATVVVRLPEVDQAVCRALRLDRGALQSKQRAWAVSHPRMIAVYLARKHTSAAYSEIGRYFGGRNHSTAVAAEKKVRQWLREDGLVTLGEQALRVRDLVELIERELLR
jgi:chromosomal replication initiator protein